MIISREGGSFCEENFSIAVSPNCAFYNRIITTYFLQDFHFSKPLEKTFLSKVELEELSRQSAASGRRDGTTREPPGLSWARVTAPCSS